jgi:hypothetical protein
MDAKQIETSIQGALDTSAGIAEIIAPQYAGFILIGKAIADATPGLIDDVTALMNGDKPTPEQVSALAQKIATLKNPENI